eukprot:1522716-Alexandrium_andersonii.AAC.1
MGGCSAAASVGRVGAAQRGLPGAGRARLPHLPALPALGDGLLPRCLHLDGHQHGRGGTGLGGRCQAGAAHAPVVLAGRARGR